MSYYDHATMMAHRLGPWADADRIEQAEMRARLSRVEGLVTWPSISTILRLFRFNRSAAKPEAPHVSIRPDQETVLCTDGDALRKT